MAIRAKSRCGYRISQPTATAAIASFTSQPAA
jgi:hypothetical protein